MSALISTGTSTPQVIASLTVAEKLLNQRSELFGQVRAGGPGLGMARKFSDAVDTAITELLTAACHKSGYHGPLESAPIAIIATGGYGRRELSPYSDIDITFVPHREGDPMVDRVIKEMFTQIIQVFMDNAKLEIGYAYRLIEDCFNLDHQTTCGLLDVRLIAGSPRIFIQLENDFWAGLNPTDFVFQKLGDRQKQLARVGTEPRSVEPNVKDGVGGLRDLQTAMWLAQTRRGLHAAAVRGDGGWGALQQAGKLTDREIVDLKDAKEFLFRTRNAMHVSAGAERDQLVVTRQEEVAAMLGYQDEPARSTPAVEPFMRDLYQACNRIHRITKGVVQRISEGRLFLGIGLDCRRGEVIPANDALAQEDASWMMTACELAQQYRLSLSPAILREVVQKLEGPAIQADLALVHESFTRVLASRQPVYPILQAMADCGLLGWVLPEFADVLDLIPYDPSHDHTVGQHTLFVIRNLDELRTPSIDEESRYLRALLADLPNPEELMLAALLHDAGKDEGDRPHSETGADLAKVVCQRLGWNERASSNVEFLVRQHLLMDSTSRLRDLNLEETIREFTAVVDDIDRLHMLTLLTYADSLAVGAGVWSQPKGRFLRDLYLRAERVLAGEQSDEFDDASLARMRRRLRQDLETEGQSAAAVADHVEGMPPTYLLNTTPEDMNLHIGYAKRAAAGEPVVDFRDERGTSFSEILVCVQDDPTPGLLAKIAGALLVADVDVHSAQVYTRSSGNGVRIALDTLVVDFRGRQLTPGKRKEIAGHLQQILSGGESVEALLSKRNPQSKVSADLRDPVFRHDLAGSLSLIEVRSSDARSTLYRASRALSALGWDIHSARLAMYAGEQVASFTVSGARDLSVASAEAKLRSALQTV